MKKYWLLTYDYYYVEMTKEDKKNTRIQTVRKIIIKRSVCDLCWLKMYFSKNTLMSK